MEKFTKRDYQLLKRAKETLLKNVVESPKNGWQGKCIIPSFDTYIGIWNWDSAFQAMTTSLFDKELSYNHFHVFYKVQKKDGMFPDAIIIRNNSVFIAKKGSKPPVFPWAFVESYKRNPDKKELSLAYKKFVKNETFWTTKRFYNGLFHYDCCDRSKGWEQISKWESGWDTSPRFDNGCSNLWSIDLNCYMVLFYKSLEFMAKKLNKTDEILTWKSKRITLSKTIRKTFWDKNSNCFYDYDYQTKQFVKTLTPASLMPLFVKIATKDQAEYVAQKTLKYLYPSMPSVSFDDKNYTQTDFWRGPTWLNIAYFAAVGLKNYGYYDMFFDISNCVLDWCHKEKYIHEYYNSKTGKGLGAKNFSWSACFIIEFIKELYNLTKSKMKKLLN